MSVVETIKSEYNSVIEFLANENQPTYESDINKHFKKVLLLSAASFFEHEIQNIIISFVSTNTKDNGMVVALLKNKAITQQYHTYFDWGEKDDPTKPRKNANKFFALFGAEFKQEMVEELKENEELNNSIKAFIEIGHLRNILVHRNFGAFNLDTKTTEEIYELYKKATKFIDFLKNRLK